MFGPKVPQKYFASKKDLGQGALIFMIFLPLLVSIFFCQDRGCGKFFTCDGHWKTAYPICMFTGPETSHDYLPSICTDSPLPGKIV